MRRAVRTTTKVVIGLMLLSSAVWAFALQDNWVAVMRNSSMEPAVPMGALVVANDAHDAGGQIGDVVIYSPLPTRYPLATLNRLHRLVFGIREVARQGGRFLYADNQPTVRLPSLDPNLAESMNYYIPLVGYPLWFGPVEPLVVAGLLAIALYLTRSPIHQDQQPSTSPRSIDALPGA